MLNSLQNIYWSQDLPGELFFQPLKAYHGFVAKKIELSTSLAKIAWVVVAIVSGIFAYPTFGLIASFGFVLKLAGISKLKQHNEAQKNNIKGLASTLKYALVHYEKTTIGVDWEWTDHIIGPDLKKISYMGFTITKADAEDTCQIVKTQIDWSTTRYRKVYVDMFGFMNDGQIQFDIWLSRKRNLHFTGYRDIDKENPS